MKLLIVGEGFIGSEFARYARTKGHRVSTMDRNGGDYPSPNWDIRREETRVLDYEFDLVAIFAAETSTVEFENHPTASMDTNVHGLFNVLAGCHVRKVPKVFFASSSSVYSDTLYGASKRVGEALVEGYSRAGSFESVSARFFNTYGSSEDAKGPYRSMVSQFAECKALGRTPTVYGDGNQKRDFIHVRDAARIAFELCKAGRTGAFDVGTGRATSYNRILDLLGLKERKYVPNPLKHFQSFTKANTTKLESYGLKAEIRLERGLKELLGHYQRRPSSSGRSSTTNILET